MDRSSPTREDVILERLRERYEREGYRFFAYPIRDLIPPFLAGYRPDAIALREKGGIIIELKAGDSPSRDHRLAEIARRFEGQTDWTFKIFVDNQFNEPESLPEAASEDEIAVQLAEIDELTSSGHIRAAFVLGWAALEAATRRLLQKDAKWAERPMRPSDIPELLAHNGHVDQLDARRLRDLVALRNATLHGDLKRRVDREDVTLLQRTVRSLIQPPHDGH